MPTVFITEPDFSSPITQFCQVASLYDKSFGKPSAVEVWGADPTKKVTFSDFIAILEAVAQKKGMSAEDTYAHIMQ